MYFTNAADRSPLPSVIQDYKIDTCTSAPTVPPLLPPQTPSCGDIKGCVWVGPVGKRIEGPLILRK